ncbi:MAG: MotB family protein [Nitratireductor sp.]|nr:MotB family protein [Nitratireductor sp.]
MIEERSEERQEIIIVRRHDPGEDEGHHGGVWKIAFADFMTAMMAFFLVMWLINAANEETKKAVASYFTPIKLTDKTSNPKGLNSPKYGQPTEESSEADDSTTFTSGGKLNQRVPDPVQVNEQALFTDPYAVLSEIAGGFVSGEARPGEQPEIGDKKDGLGTTGGDAFHDPFDPSSWNTELGSRDKVARNDAANPAIEADKPAGESGDAVSAGKANARLEQMESNGTAQEDAPAGRGPKSADQSGRMAADAGNSSDSIGEVDRDAAGLQAEQAHMEANGKVADRLRGELQSLLRRNGTDGPSVEVVADGAGVKISVADEFKFGMFDIGSSVPRPETVNAMAEIGKMLARTAGQVIVSGHTDARKFSKGGYDNWRLSTDRANIARYMLIRGGLEEARFERVEGFAASRPKLPDDPLAAANRRIEILVRLP